MVGGNFCLWGATGGKVTLSGDHVGDFQGAQPLCMRMSDHLFSFP